MNDYTLYVTLSMGGHSGFADAVFCKPVRLPICPMPGCRVRICNTPDELDEREVTHVTVTPDDFGVEVWLEVEPVGSKVTWDIACDEFARGGWNRMAEA